MTKTLTATYDDPTALINVVDDLINDGLEREKIFSDKENKFVKVIIPDTIEPEISAILKRHHPTSLR
ncbi:MAG TPA: hypothetical protein PL143_17320 [Rhodocyclaceae bacterium]|nr:hypothetical protein [Rhodocyclaceae bacterium]